VLKLLTNNITKTYVRKKAALTTLRLFRKSSDILPAEQWADKILQLLDEKNIGVLTSVTSLVLGILAVDPTGWEGASHKAARTLTRLVLNKDYSNDYLYYGIPTPWLQIKLLRVLQHFPPPAEHALKVRVSEVLQKIISGTEVTKNVNKNNATHAVLFEAINLSIHLGSHGQTLQQCINLLGRFISIREANIRYLGLETMARLSEVQPETLDGLKKHQSTILFSLKDPDISIRRRALDLVYAMCDTSSVKETVSELLVYLAAADAGIKEELVLKIAILSERFASDHAWYVDVVIQLIKSAGDYVADEIWYRVVQIVTNQGDDLQKHATEAVWRSLTEERYPHKTLVKVTGYILGEFGHMISDRPGSSPSQQLQALHRHYTTSEPEVRALLLNTYVKLAHTYSEVAPQVGEIMQQHSAAMDQEVQQRAAEYISLSAPGMAEIKGTVLEMMPHFTERESIVQKTLTSKNQLEGGAAPTSRADTRSAPEPPPAAPTRAAPAPDLLGGLDEPSPPVTTSAADLLAGLDLGGAPSPPSASRSAAADLLDLMGGNGSPAPQAAGVDLLGGMGVGGGAAASTAAAGAPTPQWIALCMRNDGVLFEDATVQIGVKMDFQGHQGRLGLFFGNKTQAPLMCGPAPHRARGAPDAGAHSSSSSSGHAPRSAPPILQAAPLTPHPTPPAQESGDGPLTMPAASHAGLSARADARAAPAAAADLHDRVFAGLRRAAAALRPLHVGRSAGPAGDAPAGPALQVFRAAQRQRARLFPAMADTGGQGGAEDLQAEDITAAAGGGGTGGGGGPALSRVGWRGPQHGQLCGCRLDRHQGPRAAAERRGVGAHAAGD
jgi:AP-2 complex subunit alpha